MKETFTEEEYKDVLKKFNEIVSSELYDNIQNYPTYENYVDLKEYELSELEFKMLWKCQEILTMYDSNKYQLSEKLCIVLNSLKEYYDSFFEKEV